MALQQRRRGGQQVQSRFGVGQPGADLVAAQDQRHPVVDAVHRGIGRGGQNHKPIGPIHIVIQARQVERLARQGELVLVAGGIPLVKRGGRDDAPLRRHAAAEHWLFADRLGAGVDHQACQ